MSQTDPDATARAAGAAIFEQGDVVASYYARQPYAPAAYEALLGQVAGRARALDIGCGPGVVARVLAKHFAEVVAVDPSTPMIATAKADGGGGNIRWVQARAEELSDDAGFDLVTAGSSIHFADPAVLFPKLAGWTEVFATFANDPLFPSPPPPCGLEAWVDFLSRWRLRIGHTPPAAWRNPEAAAPSEPASHEVWMDIRGRERFRFDFHQSVEDFIASCHSRVSWPREAMGHALADEFDAELEALLRPFAVGGLLRLDILTDLVWGAPRRTPRA